MVYTTFSRDKNESSPLTLILRFNWLSYSYLISNELNYIKMNLVGSPIFNMD